MLDLDQFPVQSSKFNDRHPSDCAHVAIPSRHRFPWCPSTLSISSSANKCAWLDCSRREQVRCSAGVSCRDVQCNGLVSSNNGQALTLRVPSR